MRQRVKVMFTAHCQCKRNKLRKKEGYVYSIFSVYIKLWTHKAVFTCM